MSEELGAAQEQANTADYVSKRTFADFPISPSLLKGITEKGYTNATPVQAATIDPALAGKDLIVRAKTGTGKTAAFVVPLLELIEDGVREPRAVILAPTRELAQQIAEVAIELSKYRDIRVATLVGGLAMGPQEKALDEGASFIVGTPGRLLDHARRKNLNLSTATAVCLDEADEMLSMGFFKDVSDIIGATKDERQVLLYSATISPDTQRLVDRFLKDPENVYLSTDADNVSNITHVLYETKPDTHKVRSLLYLIDNEDPTSAIIFCNTREDTATVASFLDRQGLDVQLISGELSQAKRSEVMAKVKAGNVKFLVSTDVAARGIDISGLSHVINYSLPQDPSVYLHRTGRTGRIGNQGTAISLVGGPDLATRRVLEGKHKLKFEHRELPDSSHATEMRVERQAKQIKAALGGLVFESFLPTVKALKKRKDGDMLIAAALRAFFLWDRQRKAEAGEISSVQSLLAKRNEKLNRKSNRSGGRGSRDRDRGGSRDRDRGSRDRDRDRGGSRDRDQGSRRGSRSSSQSKSTERAPATEELDLDSFLVVAEPAEPAEKPKKKSRKRKRKPKAEKATHATDTEDFFDLDSLLSTDG